MNPQELAQQWSDLGAEEQQRRIATVTPCLRPGFVIGEGRPNAGQPAWIGDVAATTHIQSYDAYRAFGGPSGFSGTGNAVIDSATGNVIEKHAFRFDALKAQHAIEAQRAKENELEDNQDEIDAAIAAEEERIANDPDLWP